MRRVVVGKAAGTFEQAVGIRSRKKWFRHKMSRKQLVGITGQKLQAGGGRKVLVPGGTGGLGGVDGTSSGGYKVES